MMNHKIKIRNDDIHDGIWIITGDGYNPAVTSDFPGHKFHLAKWLQAKPLPECSFKGMFGVKYGTISIITSSGKYTVTVGADIAISPIDKRVISKTPVKDEITLIVIGNDGIPRFE